MLSEYIDGAILFLCWWAVWSLLDAYALRYTPFSELAVLAVCAIAKLAPALTRAVRLQVRRGETVLKEALDAV